MKDVNSGVANTRLVPGYRKSLRRIFATPLCLFVLSTGSFSNQTFSATNPFLIGTSDEVVNQIDTIVKNKTTTKANMNSLIDVLKSPDAEIRVRERAAWALGMLRNQAAIPALIEASNHKGLLVRSAALDSLVRLRARAALPAFVRIAESDPILSLRQRATLALGLLQWDKTIPSLVKLSSDPNMEIQGAAATAMAATQSSKNDFSQALKEMSEESDAHVRDRALRGLEIISRKNSVIRGHLTSDDVDVRLFAAVYFRQHGASADTAAIKSAMNGESDDDVRAEMKEALNAINRRASEAKKKAAAAKKGTAKN